MALAETELIQPFAQTEAEEVVSGRLIRFTAAVVSSLKNDLKEIDVNSIIAIRKIMPQETHEALSLILKIKNIDEPGIENNPEICRNTGKILATRVYSTLNELIGKKRTGVLELTKEENEILINLEETKTPDDKDYTLGKVREALSKRFLQVTIFPDPKEQDAQDTQSTKETNGTKSSTLDLELKRIERERVEKVVLKARKYGNPRPTLEQIANANNMKLAEAVKIDAKLELDDHDQVVSKGSKFMRPTIKADKSTDPDRKQVVNFNSRFGERTNNYGLRVSSKPIDAEKQEKTIYLNLALSLLSYLAKPLEERKLDPLFASTSLHKLLKNNLRGHYSSVLRELSIENKRFEEFSSDEKERLAKYLTEKIIKRIEGDEELSKRFEETETTLESLKKILMERLAPPKKSAQVVEIGGQIINEKRVRNIVLLRKILNLPSAEIARRSSTPKPIVEKLLEKVDVDKDNNIIPIEQKAS